MSATETLGNIFGAYVNQGTLEEAATLMASLTQKYPDLADQFTVALKIGCAGESDASGTLIEAVNRSGYRVSTTVEAIEYCRALLNLYLQRIHVLAN